MWRFFTTQEATTGELTVEGRDLELKNRDHKADRCSDRYMDRGRKGEVLDVKCSVSISGIVLLTQAGSTFSEKS